jgi:murein DD-endopeptidase MepM/ murein hydrolase activator NlpD
VGSGNSTGAHLHFSIDQSINPGVYRAIFNNASTWTIGNDTRALAAAESDIEDDSTEEDDDNEIVIVI